MTVSPVMFDNARHHEMNDSNTDAFKCMIRLASRSSAMS